MAAGILSGMEGKLNTKGWRWFVFTMFFNDYLFNKFQLHRLFYIEVGDHCKFNFTII